MALPTASDNEFPKVIMEEVADDGSATVTPAADHRALFLGEDGALHLKDSSGTVTSVAAGSGLEFTALSKVQVFNGSTTNASISKALTAAITGVPADAVMVSGWISVSANGAANNGNYIAVHHGNGSTDTDQAAIARQNGGSGIVTDAAFLVKCQQSSGAKVYYDVGRAANTVTYYMNVTGYWTPA